VLLRDLELSSLIVNPNNDRHGDLKHENDAIRWLLKNKTDHMKNLAEDIVLQGQIYEPPLVAPLGKKYVVYDGNRRVCCLKLLDNPALAAEEKLQHFFSNLVSQSDRPFWRLVSCQVETDRDRVDEILYRRHTGSQGGVGQSDWDDVAKSNFVNRTGKHQALNVAEAIEGGLVTAGAEVLKGTIPRSNMNRLFSGESTRNRVGLTVKGNQICFTHEPAAVLETLRRIADDLVSKDVVLSDLWDNAAKHRYIDRLDQAGLLPAKAALLSSPMPFEAGTSKAYHKAATANAKAARLPRPQPSPPRNTLIPSSVNYNISWGHETQRIREIWDELQFHLVFDRHKNAIAVLMRVCLELSTDVCIKKLTIQGVHQNDKLAMKIEKTAKHLEASSRIDSKYLGEIKKLSNSDAIISSDTMNRYVHSPTFNPSPSHIIALWDTLSRYIVECLNS
jgi:hypothetical protein